MGTHAITLGLEQNGISIQYPTWRAANITAVSQISDSTSLRTDNTDIRIGIMTIADKLKRKPLAIGRPFVIESASCIVPCRTVCHLTYFLGFQVEYHQPVTVFDKSQFLTIRRVLRVSTFYGFGGEQYFLFNKSSVREIRLFFTSYLSGIKLPVAGPLAGINQCTVVGSKRYTGFLCRSICYLLGRSIIG